MAAGINPAMIAQLLKGGAGGQATPQPGGGGGGDESLAPATREMGANDPTYALKLINNLKKQIADMIPTLAFRAPAASRALVSTFKGFDTAIKELTEAMKTMQAVGGGVQNSAIPQPQPRGSSLGAPDVSKSSGVGM
jgi:hypothetical protein